VFRRPGENRFPERLGRDRRRARGCGVGPGLCLAGALHPVCPFHAGVHRPVDVVRPSAARLARRQGARTRYRHGPVPGADARGAARPIACHRRRDWIPVTARIARLLQPRRAYRHRRFRAQPTCR
jgi:hypothetical protein